ncbi:MAG: type II toxin-antitoxin system VapC family toxin [Nitrospinae bacterium]|nr:type II toxin-antitoxin system VapC family toxin [Nitrospinota bacterium]
MDKKYLLDTHTLFWYLTASPKLSKKAKEIIDKGLNREVSLIVSVITLAELYFLNEKSDSPLNFSDEYKKLMLEEIFEVVSIEPEDILVFSQISEIKEMHDRLIGSTALRYKAVVITKDKEIRASNKVQAIW